MKKFKLKLEGKEILGKEQMRQLNGGYTLSCISADSVTCLDEDIVWQCVFPADFHMLCGGSTEWVCSSGNPWPTDNYCFPI